MTLNSILGVEKNTDGVPGAAGGAGNIYSGCVRNKRSLKFGTNILGNISSSDQPGYLAGTHITATKACPYVFLHYSCTQV